MLSDSCFGADLEVTIRYRKWERASRLAVLAFLSCGAHLAQAIAASKHFSTSKLGQIEMKMIARLRVRMSRFRPSAGAKVNMFGAIFRVSR
jgi:hypothetical protein